MGRRWPSDGSNVVRRRPKGPVDLLVRGGHGTQHIFAGALESQQYVLFREAVIGKLQPRLHTRRLCASRTVRALDAGLRTLPSRVPLYQTSVHDTAPNHAMLGWLKDAVKDLPMACTAKGHETGECSQPPAARCDRPRD